MIHASNSKELARVQIVSETDNKPAKNKSSPAKKASEKNKAGRPSSYSEELAQEICKRVSLGESLNAISKVENMPSHDTIYKWLRNNKSFADDYALAREERGLTYGDKLSDLIDSVLDGTYPPDVARVAIDALKWQAARLAPKHYGDKQEVTVNQTVSIAHADALMALANKAREAKLLSAPDIIDITPQRFVDPIPDEQDQ